MTEPVRGGPDSAGGMLRAAREKQGLHIAALAAAIKVAPRKLDALENNRWHELPDATFTRALAQTVCRTLKIDAKPVLDLLPAVVTGKLENVAGTLNTPFRERGNPVDQGVFGGAVRPMVWAGVLLLLAALAVYLVPAGSLPFWAPGDNATVEAAPATAASEPTLAAPVLVASAPVVPASEAATEAPAADAPDAASQPAAGPASTAAGAALAVPALPASPASAAPGPDAIRLTAVQASWVEARDAEGRVLVSRLVPAGEALVLEGETPVRLVIGNAAGVELSFRQQRIELPALTRDNVARLQLP